MKNSNKGNDVDGLVTFIPMLIGVIIIITLIGALLS